MSELYDYIEQTGKKLGYKNMTEICAAAGVPRSTMTELKKGRSKSMTIINVKKFAVLFGVSLDEFSPENENPAADDGGEVAVIMDYLLSLPLDRLRGILLALAAPEDVLAALDRLERRQ